jgi:hypothetical protein
MIEFGGTIYYIDLDAYDNLVRKPITEENKYVVDTHRKTYLDDKQNITGVEINEQSTERVQELYGTKYDIIRIMIEVVLDSGDDDEMDDSMGSQLGLENGSFSFKIAFNTLHHYGIIKEKE